MKLHSLVCAGLAAGLILAGQALAQPVVINIDWNNGTADPTYVGDDGILSSAGGTFWNGLDAGASAFFPSLDTEFGIDTPVDVIHTNAIGGYAEPGPPGNDLQLSGYSGELVSIRGLLPGQPYDVAIYMGQNSGVFEGLGGFTSAAGNETVAFGDPTYTLPGVADMDYFLLSPRFPADLGGGFFGFTIQGFDGQILGIQIRGEIPEPASMTLLAIGGLMLVTRRR